MHRFRPVISMRFTRFCLAVGTLSGIAALGLGGQSAWADTSCATPSNGPTGPAAATFTYQCDGTYAGDWTNSYYVYDPSTGAQTALYSPDYSYDCTTNTWTQTEWDYNSGSGAYVENRVPATTTPNQATNCATTTGSDSSNSTASSGSAAATTPNASTPGTNTPGDTTAATAPPDPGTTCPTPGVGPTSSAQGGTANNSVTVNNNDCSQSQSGDANVTDNHHAGDATTGNATTEVTAANLVNSASSTTGNGTVVFTTDVNGDVNGDLVLDPSTLGANNASSTGSNDSVGTVNTDAAINNAITATAVSGDATVSGNGTGGDATTGDAEAVVNLINMINSAIASGQSFVGTININGDLNGNILIPQSVIDQLLASNAAGGSGNSLTGLNNNESITNNVNASANSGNAAVTDNGVGGNATSGNAKTNVTIMNLTGSSIVGKNVLLVFVNVLGQWIGMIVNAPTGATSAEFGGGISSNTPGNTGGNQIVEADANLSITNNVNASATSGDATVSNNWVGGNATSGNASTAVNILNIEDSTLSLANWFGILFINVFGIWNGNFGILATPAPATSSSDNSGTPSTQPNTQSTLGGTALHHHFATFLPHYSDPTATESDATSAVLGDNVAAPIAHKIESSTLPASNDSHTNFVLPLIGLCVALVLLAGAERDRFSGRTKSDN